MLSGVVIIGLSTIDMIRFSSVVGLGLVVELGLGSMI